MFSKTSLCAVGGGGGGGGGRGGEGRGVVKIVFSYE